MLKKMTGKRLMVRHMRDVGCRLQEGRQEVTPRQGIDVELVQLKLKVVN